MKIELTKATINYHIIGEGIPTLIIHGFGVDHRLMKGCLEPIFCEQVGYQRIYLDLPGMGQSVVNGINNADDMLACINEFIEQIIIDNDFILISESYGSYLSLGIINEYASKIKGSLFICPCFIANYQSRVVAKTKQVIKDSDYEINADLDVLESYNQLTVLKSSQTYQAFINDVYPSFALANQSFLNSYQAQGYTFSKLIIKSFDKPVCIFTGRNDQVVGYKDAYDLLDYYRNASFYILDNAGHNLQSEQPMIFKYGIIEWLEQIKLYSKKPY